MRRIFNLKKLFCAAVIAGAITFAGNSSVSACDYYWKNVTVYVSVEQPVVKYVTLYDHCGKEFEVQVVSSRTVQVPVTKRVKVYI